MLVCSGALGPLKESSGELGRGVFLVGIGDGFGIAVAGSEERDVAPGSAFDLEVVPGLVGQVEGDGFAGEGVAVPVGELEVVVATGKARSGCRRRARWSRECRRCPSTTSA